MTGKYILVNGKPVSEYDLLKWGKWIKDHSKERIIRQDFWIPGGSEVSTIFLGLDHRLFGEGPPILFETMIFGGPLDEYQERYCTMKEARQGHWRAVFKALLAWLKSILGG